MMDMINRNISDSRLRNLPKINQEEPESWQAKKPEIQDIDQLTLPYQVKVSDIVRAAVEDARACRTLTGVERSAKIAKIATLTIGNVAKIGLSEKEAITLLSKLIQTWKLAGASHGSKIAFEEFKQRILEIEKSFRGDEESS